MAQSSNDVLYYIESGVCEWRWLQAEPIDELSYTRTMCFQGSGDFYGVMQHLLGNLSAARLSRVLVATTALRVRVLHLEKRINNGAGPRLRFQGFTDGLSAIAWEHIAQGQIYKAGDLGQHLNRLITQVSYHSHWGQIFMRNLVERTLADIWRLFVWTYFSAFASLKPWLDGYCSCAGQSARENFGGDSGVRATSRHQREADRGYANSFETQPCRQTAPLLLRMCQTPASPNSHQLYVWCCIRIESGCLCTVAGQPQIVESRRASRKGAMRRPRDIDSCSNSRFLQQKSTGQGAHSANKKHKHCVRSIFVSGP